MMKKMCAVCEFIVSAAYSPVMYRHFLLSMACLLAFRVSAEDWPQFMFNAQHSGNAAAYDISPEGFVVKATAAMKDGIYTSPVVADGKVYVVDGSGYVACFDAATLKEVWHFQ